MAETSLWGLFVNPNLESDQTLIKLFNESTLLGHVLPVEDIPPTLCNLEQTIEGHNQILDFLKSKRGI